MNSNHARVKHKIVFNIIFLSFACNSCSITLNIRRCLWVFVLSVFSPQRAATHISCM